MITNDQTLYFTRKFKINESTIFREYLQTVFLSVLYKYPESNKIFFKGGTAIHLLLGASRFSEDLDFTVNLSKKKFGSLINLVFDEIKKQENVSFKERKTITGKRFLLSAHPGSLSYATFINLDFSFREKVIEPKKSILTTQYPVLFTSYIYHLSKEELLAEKLRAFMARKKGRDIYDIWYLLTQNVTIKQKLVQKKMKYYDLEYRDAYQIIERLNQCTTKDFELDMRPLVPLNEREKLKNLFNYIKDYIATNLHTPHI